MAPYNEDNFLMIAPGSTKTLVQFGIKDVYSPPKYEIPTRVYRHPTKEGVYSTKGEKEHEVNPIVKGCIVDLAAFKAFLKLIFNSVTKDLDPLPNIPLTLVSLPQWSRLDIESISNYIFEEIGSSSSANSGSGSGANGINGLNILPIGLAALYACGNHSCGCVINVGKEHTDVIPIVDFKVLKSSTKNVKFGGETINRNLKKLLPHLTDEQIESLKISDIYEILNEDDKKNGFFTSEDLMDSNNDDDGAFDVAEIVASGRTREILEEREKNSSNGKGGAGAGAGARAENSKLEINMFKDQNGQEISIGKERFKGSNELIEEISKKVYNSLSSITDLSKRQEAWNNLILIGSTSLIKGFQDEIFKRLFENYLIGKENLKILKKQTYQSTITEKIIEFQQVPNSIKFSKIPDYFPEWKKNRNHINLHFLGCQIVSKQLFDHSNQESFYLTRSDYNEKGPTGIWEGAFF